MATAVGPVELQRLPAEGFFRAALFLLILTSTSTLIATGKLDMVTCVLASAILLYKGLRWWRGKPAELSHRTATMVVLSYLLFFPVDLLVLSRAFVSSSTNATLYAALLSAVHFLLFVTLVRLYSATTDRDSLFLAMLSFAGILAASILTVDSSFLALFFVFILFGIAAFTALEVRRAARGAISPAPDAQPGQERRLARSLSWVALALAVGSILIGGVLFFTLPRFSAGYMGRAGLQPSLMTGFSDDIELGQIGEIKKDSTVVMRVKTGKPVGYGMLRWRGIALSNFDGKRWTTPQRRRVIAGPDPDGWIAVGFSVVPSARPAPVQLRYEILLQPIASEAIFVPANAVSIRGNFAGETVNPLSQPHSYIMRDTTDSLFNPFRNFAQLRYFGYSELPVINAAALRAAPTVYPEAITIRYLQLPTLDTRVPALAKTITQRARNPYDQATAIESYLRTRYRYTLDLSGRPGNDPLAHFLFETRAGHCEYFATAMTVMLRTLGIPSREVNGFLPGEYNELGGDYIVRASDAHSWVEAYFPGNGWVTFDPTPADAQQFGLLSRLGKYIDWMQLSWNEWVINYDFVHQVQMAQMVQRGSRSWTERARSWFENKQGEGKTQIKAGLRRFGGFSLGIPLGLFLILVGVRYRIFERGYARLKLYWQLHAPEAAGANPQLASRLYVELLRLLERRGLARRESQTPLEFAAAVGEPGLAPAVREFTQVYATARFGGAPCDTTRLRQLLDQVRTTQRTRQ
jgi:protein-glutamine gamma-glutamyltransferase